MSVRFVNKTTARRGNVVCREDVEWGELPKELRHKVPGLAVEEAGEKLRYMKSVKIDDTRFLNFSDEETTIEDVWDLPMIGSGQINIEKIYQRLIGGPEVVFQDLGGSVVESPDGVMYQLGVNPNDKPNFLRNLRPKFAKPRLELSCDPAKYNKEVEFMFTRLIRTYSDELPDDSVLVLRTEVLSEFKQLMLDKETATKVHGNTERNASKKVEVLGAALAVLAMWPEDCRDKNGRASATKIAKMVEIKANLFWPNEPPPLVLSSIEDHLREWIRKANIRK